MVRLVYDGGLFWEQVTCFCQDGREAKLRSLKPERGFAPMRGSGQLQGAAEEMQEDVLVRRLAYVCKTTRFVPCGFQEYFD